MARIYPPSLKLGFFSPHFPINGHDRICKLESCIFYNGENQTIGVVGWKLWRLFDFLLKDWAVQRSDRYAFNARLLLPIHHNAAIARHCAFRTVWGGIMIIPSG